MYFLWVILFLLVSPLGCLATIETNTTWLGQSGMKKYLFTYAESGKEVRYKLNQNELELNLGLSKLHECLSNKCRMYVYADHTINHNVVFNQMAAGIELDTNRMRMAINSYVPFGSLHKSTERNPLYSIVTEVSALPGIDMSLLAPLARGYIGLTGFKFNRQGFSKYSGGRLFFETNFRKSMNIKFEAQRNKHQSSLFLVGLDFKPGNKKTRAVAPTVIRDVDIAFGRRFFFWRESFDEFSERLWSEVKLLSGNSVYRIGDHLLGDSTILKKRKKRILDRKELKGSLLYQFYEQGGGTYIYKNNEPLATYVTSSDFKILSKIINEIRPEISGAKSNELVIYFRNGDVVDQRNKFGGSIMSTDIISALDSINSEVLTRFRTFNIVTAMHFHGKAKRNYIQNAKEYFFSFIRQLYDRGYAIKVKSSFDPDEDFIYMLRSPYMLNYDKSPSSYYKTIKMIRMGLNMHYPGGNSGLM